MSPIFLKVTLYICLVLLSNASHFGLNIFLRNIKKIKFLSHCSLQVGERDYQYFVSVSSAVCYINMVTLFQCAPFRSYIIQVTLILTIHLICFTQLFSTNSRLRSTPTNNVMTRNLCWRVKKPFATRNKHINRAIIVTGRVPYLNGNVDREPQTLD